MAAGVGAEGHTVCPVSKQELRSQQVEANTALREAIDEWRQRNVALRIQAARPKLASAKEEDVEAGLLDLFQLCEERPQHRSCVAAEGLIPTLVNILTKSSRNLRRKTLATLANLANGNDENKVPWTKHPMPPACIRCLLRTAMQAGQGPVQGWCMSI